MGDAPRIGPGSLGPGRGPVTAAQRGRRPLPPSACLPRRCFHVPLHRGSSTAPAVLRRTAGSSASAPCMPISAECPPGPISQAHPARQLQQGLRLAPRLQGDPYILRAGLGTQGSAPTTHAPVPCPGSRGLTTIRVTPPTGAAGGLAVTQVPGQHGRPRWPHGVRNPRSEWGTGAAVSLLRVRFWPERREVWSAPAPGCARERR